MFRSTIGIKSQIRDVDEIALQDPFLPHTTLVYNTLDKHAQDK